MIENEEEKMCSIVLVTFMYAVKQGEHQGTTWRGFSIIFYQNPSDCIAPFNTSNKSTCIQIIIHLNIL